MGQILQYFRAATHYDRNWYKAWHAWALANFEATAYFEKAVESGATVPAAVIADFVVPAIRGACGFLTCGSCPCVDRH